MNDVVNKLLKLTIATICSDNQVQENNIFYLCTAAGGGDSRTDLGNSVFTNYITNYQTVLSNQSSLFGWRIQTMAPLPADTTITHVDENPGPNEEPYLGSQVRPILRFRTALTGRRYRGRIYLPTPSVSYIGDDGYPTPDLRTAISALGAVLITAVVAGGSTWKPVVAHLVSTGPAVYTTEPITNYNDPGMFGTQRRSGNTGRLNPSPW